MAPAKGAAAEEATVPQLPDAGNETMSRTVYATFDAARLRRYWMRKYRLTQPEWLKIYRHLKRSGILDSMFAK